MLSEIRGLLGGLALTAKEATQAGGFSQAITLADYMTVRQNYQGTRTGYAACTLVRHW